MKKIIGLLSAIWLLPAFTMASEANLVIPQGIKNETILYWGFAITLIGFLFGLNQC